MSNLPTLYELADEYKAVSDKLHDMELDEQTIADTLESISGDLEAKCTNIGFVIRNMESFAMQMAQAESSMAARRKALENRAEHIRNYLKQNMERCNMSKIESPWFKIAIRQNPSAVVIDAATQIPSEFWRKPEPLPPAIDRKAIKAAIEAGNEVPGAHLERGTRLEIK